MKQVVVLSGKGGTGKTSLAAALAHSAYREYELVLADADVDAANLEILLQPELIQEYPFTGAFKAAIDPAACTGCGICSRVCRFGAIEVAQDCEGDVYRIDRISCEGCNSCLHQCPENAITSRRQVAGRRFRSESVYGPLFHAEMKAGEENSGKLVTEVKNEALERAAELDEGLLIVDGPPGIGCPVIAACAGADMAVVSTEPGVSAIHDLNRILDTVRHFGVPSAVCINRSDINEEKSKEIEVFCRKESIPLLGRIPYDPAVTRAMAKGLPVNAFDPTCPASEAIEKIYGSLRNDLIS
ncbi:MAG: P-loop NTPase [Candidatus Aegiribacteria sp.]|nr:P-loop NTPase [Candidatus Aegiribacteria sp.]MBD3294858.1 P-loop NTPase [Candidatus Fermentibacteria bacterium]